jgi:putative transcriptional regulator
MPGLRCNMLLEKLRSDGGGQLGGQLLVAMPGMHDERFQRSVIYICGHSPEGAMGIVINHRKPSMTFRDLIVQLDLVEPDEAIKLPRHVSHAHVLRGGPVETSRGFVLHSADFAIENVTEVIDNGICLTSTLDILKAIVNQKGPSSALLALGYAGWSPGQLEREIAANGWLHCPCDPDLLFNGNIESKYDLALKTIGVDPLMLSSTAGRA